MRITNKTVPDNIPNRFTNRFITKHKLHLGVDGLIFFTIFLGSWSLWALVFQQTLVAASKDLLINCGPEIWRQNYNGSGNGTDVIYDLAIDTAGNAYVTGTVYSSDSERYTWITIKYNTQGVQEWVDVYKGQTDGAFKNEGRFVAVDQTGYIYLAGSPNSNAIVIRKLNSDGQALWQQHFAIPNEPQYVAHDLVLVNQLLYVIASSVPGYNYILIYDLDGNLLRQIKAPLSNETKFRLDREGNLFLTTQFYVVKFSNSGEQLWETQLGGDVHQDLQAFALDESGNTYILTSSEWIDEGQHSRREFSIIKVDAIGSRQWQKRYRSPQGSDAFAADIAVNKNGEIYAIGSGHWYDNAQWDLTILKLTSSGELLWETHNRDFSFNNESPSVLTLDEQGNLIIVAMGLFGPGYWVTLKYNPDGILAWLAINPGESAEAKRIMISNTNEIYVAGTAAYNFALIKYSLTGDTTGTFLITKDTLTIEGDEFQQGDEIPKAHFHVSLTRPAPAEINLLYRTPGGDPNAGIDYIATEGILTIPPGESEAEILIPVRANNIRGEAPKPFNLDLLCASNASIVNPVATATVLDNDVDLKVWETTYDTQVDTHAYIGDIKIDSTQNILIATSNAALRRWILLKYSPSGKVVWEQPTDGMVFTLITDSQDNIYVAGQLETTNQGTDFWLAKYNNQGERLWQYTLDGSAHSGDNVNQIAADSMGNVFATGVVTSLYQADKKQEPHQHSDMVTVKLDPQGNLIWQHIYDSGFHTADEAYRLVVDQKNNIYVGGISYQDSVNTIQTASISTHMLLLTYNEQGDLIREEQYWLQSLSNAAIQVRDMQLEKAGGLIIKVLTEKGSYLFRITPGVADNGQRCLIDLACGSGVVGAFEMDDSGGLIAVYGAVNLIRYNQFGNIVWRQYFSYYPLGTYFSDLTIDHNRFLYATGIQHNEINGGTHIVMFKFNPSGERLVRQVWPDSPQTREISGRFIWVDEAGNVYVIGYVGSEVKVIKYRPETYPVTIAIENRTGIEQSAGVIHVPVRLSRPTSQDTIINYYTIDGTATHGANYISASGTITIPAQAISTTININLLDDEIQGKSTFFFVRLFSPNGANITDSVGQVLILDRDSRLHYLPTIYGKLP